VGLMQKLIGSMRSLTIASGVAVLASCDSSAPQGLGTLAVKSLAQSVEPFVFEYGVVVDSEPARTAFLGQTLFFFTPATAQADHIVSTTGLPAVCSGGSSKTVSVQPGDTVAVEFAILCARTTGDINVTVTTTGSNIDADGYRIVIDSVPGARVDANGVRLVRWQAVGSHLVALDEVAGNCTKPSSQTKSVSAAGTTDFNFSVTCAPEGFLKVVSTISGSDRDPDGTLVLFGPAGYRIPPSGTTVQRVNTGVYNFGIFDVAPNCALSVIHVGSRTITAGDTATLNVPLSCVSVGAGVEALSVTDPVGDTLAAEASVQKAHDIVSLAARFEPGWLLLVVRFANPVTAKALSLANGLFGNIDLDLDEDFATGRQPLVNTVGGSAEQGVDYSVSFFAGDSSSAELHIVGVPPFAIVGRVRTVYAGDSVVVQIPLEKMGNTDGNMTLSAIFGTAQRITDIVPNAGRLTLRFP
jgi:hypothetical protein